MNGTMGDIVFGVIVVVLLETAIRAVGRRRKKRSELQSPPPAPSDAQAILLAQQGKKIEAIRMIRQLHGVDLKEAKVWVESGGSAYMPAVSPIPAPAAVDEDAIAIAMAGNKIAAIKLIRERHGVGLKEAKDWIDAAVRQRDGR